MKYELISHPLCPFNQRCVITALKKGLQKERNLKITYVDLGNIPEWFLEISPEKAFPVLRLENRELLFKTQIINNFLDEDSAGFLRDESTLVHAKDRLWIERAAEYLNTLRDVFIAPDEKSFLESKNKLFDLFRITENYLEQNPFYFRNHHFTLVDGAFAPLFMLMFHFDSLKNDPAWLRYPNTKKWGLNLLEDAEVQASACPDYRGEFEYFLSLFESYFPIYNKI